MTITLLAIDPRWQHPARLACMRVYLPEDCELVIPRGFDADYLRREAHSAEVLLGGQTRLGADLMDAAPNLRLIGKLGNGVDSIDVEAATARGIPVAHSPAWLRADPVAEHVFTFMLMLSRHPWLWVDSGPLPLHTPLQGATLGIVGLGHIGQRVARRAAAFDMRIVAYTRTPGRFQPEGMALADAPTLPALLAESDYVVLCLPLTPETQGIVGAREIALMKPSAFLINVARGRHVVTDALVAALTAGQLAGAGLDVTDPEPLPVAHPLRNCANVLLSPHVAGQSEAVQRESCKLLCESIRQVLNGERVQAIVNPEVYGR